jgi:hypothetical protein
VQPSCLTGILPANGGPPVSKAEFGATNAWSDTYDGTLYVVWAGTSNIGESASASASAAESNRPLGEPAVILYTTRCTGAVNLTLIGTFPLASADLTLKITGYHDGALTLTDLAGTRYTFVLATDTYARQGN